MGSDPLDLILLRCERTKNLCGTDTIMVGGGCVCLPCEVYGLRAENARLREALMQLTKTGHVGVTRIARDALKGKGT